MRTKKGEVVSAKMDKTIVVSVVTYKTHERYKKSYRVTKKFYAHDESGIAKEGDLVEIEEIRPMSKLKRWKLVEKK